MITLSECHIIAILSGFIVLFSLALIKARAEQRRLQEERFPTTTSCPQCGSYLVLSSTLSLPTNDDPTPVKRRHIATKSPSQSPSLITFSNSPK